MSSLQARRFAAVFLVTASVSHAVYVPFDTLEQFTGNFIQTYDSAPGGNTTYDTAGQNVKFLPTGLLGGLPPKRTVLRYSPGGLPGPLFLDGPLSVDFSTPDGSGAPTIGILARIQDSGLGVGAFFTRTAADFLIRLAYDVPTNGEGGTVFWQAAYSFSSNVLTPGSGFAGGSIQGDVSHIAQSAFARLILTGTSGPNPVFNLTVSDALGSVTSGDIPLSVAPAYGQAGGAGFEMSSSVGRVFADNFAGDPVPEPTAASLLFAGALWGAVGRHRRQMRLVSRGRDLSRQIDVI